MPIRIVAAIILLAVSAAMAFAAERTPAPKDARVYIIWPPDGTVIRGGKLWVRMGLRNAGVAPKGVCLPKHTLQLLLGDCHHVPHDPPLYSKKITIIVPPY
jgi:hypothetical protein